MTSTATSTEDKRPDGGAPLRPGSLVGGKYRIEREIGRGGMGIVYLAQQEGEPRRVVIKTLAPEGLTRPGAVARFDREARSLQALRHSNIVEMFDFGRDGEQSYLVMEYLQGEALDKYLARKGRLPLEDFVPIAAQILKGVGFAHDRDLVIRDIKPAHVMLGRRGRRANFVKLLDFGLAKLVSDDNPITSEFALGTLGFIAPEALVGAPSGLRVDVFALGVLFYLMLSGEMPQYIDTDDGRFDSAVPLASALPESHGLPPALLEMVDACLRRDPSARPANANEVVELLIDAVPAQLFRLPLVEKGGATVERVSPDSPNTGVIEFETTHSMSGPASTPPNAPTEPVGTHGLDSPITTEVYNRGRRGALFAGVFVGAVAAAGGAWLALGGASSQPAPQNSAAEPVPVAVAASPVGSAEEAPAGTVKAREEVEAPVPVKAASVEKDEVETAKWSVEVQPEGANVILDGVRVGDSPYTGSLAIGKHTLVVEAEGYNPWSGEFEVVVGGHESLSIDLVPAAQTGRGRRSRRRGGAGVRPAAHPDPANAPPEETDPQPSTEPSPEKSSVLLSGSKKKKSKLLLGDN